MVGSGRAGGGGLGTKLVIGKSICKLSWIWSNSVSKKERKTSDITSTYTQVDYLKNEMQMKRASLMLQSRKWKSESE